MRSTILTSMLLTLSLAGCGIHRLADQSNTAFDKLDETIEDCIQRKLVEEPEWCPAEDNCVRPVVNEAEVERHRVACRKEGE